MEAIPKRELTHSKLQTSDREPYSNIQLFIYWVVLCPLLTVTTKQKIKIPHNPAKRKKN